MAIGVSGQQHGFVPVSEEGDVLAPAKLWCDTSTVSECDDILASAGKPFSAATVGSITTGFTAPKIRWLKNHKPDAYAKLKTVMLPHDYINFYLTGNRVTECGDASGTGALDVRNRCWSKEMLHAIDPHRDLLPCFPDIIAAHESAGTVLPRVAKELALSENVIVSAGGGDNMMAAIGTGNVTTGRLTASLGTSGTLFAYSNEPVVDTTGFLAAFCSSTGGWLPLLCTMNCTVATEQLRKLFNVDVDKIDDMVGKIGPGCDGLLTLPFYNGERSPNLPKGKAVLFGLDPNNTTQGHMLRSAMEAGVFGLKSGLVALEQLGMRFSEVTVTGGGSTSAIWRQICADVLNLRVRSLKETENAALGAALQALWCYHHHNGNNVKLEDITAEHVVEDREKECCPSDAVDVYEDVYRRYAELLHTLTPLFRKSESGSQ